MRRPIGKTLGTVAASLVLLMTVLSLVGVGPSLGHLVPREVATSNVARPVPHVVPVGNPSLINARGQHIAPDNVSIGISYTTHFSLYMQAPFAVNGTLTPPASGTSSSSQAIVSAEFRIFTGSCGGAGVPCPTVTNATVSTGPISTTTFTYNVTSALVASSGYANGQLPQAEYQLITWYTATNITAVGNLTVGASQNIYLILTPPSATFLSPTPGANLSGGNVTVAAMYSGDWVTGANVSIYSGTTLVFSTGIFSPGPGAHAAAFSWAAASAGSYKLVATVSTPAGTNSTTETVSVTTTNNVVYLNKTYYQNATVIPGVGPGATAAILLVIGLIIGMLVALALARALWGGTPVAVAPAQPWAGTKPAGYECSVCHQTFATQAELDEHAKTAHGINP
jgi:hypothetical protein